MAQKKRIEVGGAPSPLVHPHLARMRFFLDLFVMALVLLGFLFFVFTLIPAVVFLSIAIFCVLYTYVARKFI